MKSKQVFALIAGIVLILFLVACGSTPQTGQLSEPVSLSTPDEKDTKTENDIPISTPEQLQESNAETKGTSSHAEANETKAPAEPSADALVVFFSATGTTKGVAEKIAAVTGADLYEIIPAEPYSSADLNYNDTSSRSTKEQNDKSARPAITSETLDLSGYTTIYLGFPIWWGEEPRILDTFVELYDFTGKTLIPFCTSGGSGIGRSGPNMEALAGSGTWLDGKRFSRTVSEDELRTWIEGLR